MFANNILADFSYGERDIQINEKYVHLGWDNYWEQDEWWVDSKTKMWNKFNKVSINQTLTKLNGWFFNYLHLQLIPFSMAICDLYRRWVGNEFFAEFWLFDI